MPGTQMNSDIDPEGHCGRIVEILVILLSMTICSLLCDMPDNGAVYGESADRLFRLLEWRFGSRAQTFETVSHQTERSG
jgi:hypothetical protein